MNESRFRIIITNFFFFQRSFLLIIFCFFFCKEPTFFLFSYSVKVHFSRALHSIETVIFNGWIEYEKKERKKTNSITRMDVCIHRNLYVKTFKDPPFWFSRGRNRSVAGKAVKKEKFLTNIYIRKFKFHGNK